VTLVHYLLRLGASILVLAILPPPELRRFEAVEPHMGTLVRITVYAPAESAANEGFRAAFDRIRDLDATLSDYKPDSELNEVTRVAVGRAVPVSADLFTVVQASQELAEATSGAFDITLGPVVRLWREARKSGHVPDPAALQDAASRTGYRKLHLDSERRTVSFDIPGMALDVGAIAKGYAASEAVAVLDRLGIRSALVAVSGDLAFSNAPPGQRGWEIGVRSDDTTDTSVPRVLALQNAAVSTAGSTEQHLDADGRRYSHIIDPSSRMGLVDDITVTVIAGHGIDADGLDTAVSVVGAERGLALIESRPSAAALVTVKTSSGTTFRQSSRFRALVQDQAPGR
jgi:thiamine biosynthesis lipoprotein